MHQEKAGDDGSRKDKAIECFFSVLGQHFDFS